MTDVTCLTKRQWTKFEGFVQTRFLFHQDIPTWKRMKPAAVLWLTVFQMAVYWFPWEIKWRRCTQWTGMTPYVWPVTTHQQSSQPLREKTSHTANVGCAPRKGSGMTPAGTALTAPASHHSVSLSASWTTTPSSCTGLRDQTVWQYIPYESGAVTRS